MHHASVRHTEPLTVETETERWAYAVSFPLDTAALVEAGVRAVRLTLDLVVSQGRLGVLIVADDLTTVLTKTTRDLAPGTHRADLVFDRIGMIAHLVLRNNTPQNGRCVFTVRSIDAEQTDDTASFVSRLDEVLTGSPPRIHLGRVRRLLASTTGATKVHAQAASKPGKVSVVTVDALHERLGLPAALEYPLASKATPLVEWKMEINDAPILHYLYRSCRPRRHLEFGTWEGTGACYCLSESDATVWTINLPEGERIEGRPAYHSTQQAPPPGAVSTSIRGDEREYQTDAGVFIGHKYRSAGFGHRVCQILCDSRNWDTSCYPSDFFDSVLIDGGHTADVVLSDTRKALAVTRPGALIMWHDFCPDPSVFDAFGAVAGVMTGLIDHWEEIAGALRDVFWVQPSFLLIGIRK